MIARIGRRINALDWDAVLNGVLTAFFVLMGITMLVRYLPHVIGAPSEVFADTRLYYRATEAWLTGQDPWQVAGPDGIVFGAPPPALLLNLPLIPLGVENARFLWILAGPVAWLFVLRRLRLPVWWWLFPPFIEAYLAGTADVVLAAFAVHCGAAVTAITKPYSIPAILADGRYRALAIGGAMLLVTVPILPWGLFFQDLPSIRGTIEAQAAHVSAWGDPPLMVAAVIALASLGPKRALWLATPALWPSAQLHYSIFSAKVGARSAGLALALAIPGFTAHLVVIYAIGVRLASVPRALRSRRARQTPLSRP